MSVKSSPVNFFVMWKIRSSYFTQRLPMTWVCRDFDSRSVGQVQESTGRKSAKFVFWRNFGSFFFTTRLVMTWGASWFWQRSYGQVLGHWKEKCKIRLIFFLWRIILQTKITYDLKVGHDFVLRSRSLKKVHNLFLLYNFFIEKLS